ncbi:hypothetical protein V6Z12_D10G069100 [Gossypium hirsutum]
MDIDILLVLSSFALALVTIHAQNQSGGVSGRVLPEFTTNVQQQVVYLRSFPEGERNCYNLTLKKGDRYLIRATFMYGNYDQRNDLPQFDLYLGPSLWDKVILPNAAFGMVREVIHVLQSNYLHICLAFEKHHLHRWLNGAPSKTRCLFNKFPQDIYDRAWWPYQETDWTQITTSSKIETGNGYQPPLRVMRSACIPANASLPLSFPINSTVPDVRYYLISPDSREFNNYTNGSYYAGPYSPTNLFVDTLYSPAALDAGQIYLERTANPTLPPIFNAIELYTVKEFLQLQTKLEGNPCTPRDFLWERLNCTYEHNSSPRIISLNLSSSGLTAGIPPYIQNLSQLQYLDLSNNSLTGPVPEFLSKLQSLTILNLNDNSLNGSVPAELVEKSKNGLTLSVEGNPNLCAKASCIKKKNNKTVVPLVASVVSFAVLLTVVAILWRLFKYSEVQRMTNNFQRVLGNGVFGTVFHGCFNDTQVAVKMLSESSAQGYKQFHAEVELLLRVHHRNLTPLIGYCDDGSNPGLVYEFMAKGNLAEHLSGNSSNILTWEQRLRRALEAAQGLEYLHNGCRPPIIHRDVKCTNIFSQIHVSTVVAGTLGYLDPKLTEKSDVYNFGMDLLEIIKSRPMIDRTSRVEATHIKQWVDFMLSNGGIKNIVDSRLQGDFDTNSVWKVVEIAMACNFVVVELAECLSSAIDTMTERGDEDEPRESIEKMTVNFGFDTSPLAR